MNQNDNPKLDERLRDPLYLPLKAYIANLERLLRQGRTDDALRFVLKTQREGLLKHGVNWK
jgi:hypothetical protein